MDRTRTGDGYPIDLQSTALTTQPPSLINLKFTGLSPILVVYSKTFNFIKK